MRAKSLNGAAGAARSFTDAAGIPNATSPAGTRWSIRNVPSAAHLTWWRRPPSAPAPRGHVRKKAAIMWSRRRRPPRRKARRLHRPRALRSARPGNPKAEHRMRCSAFSFRGLWLRRAPTALRQKRRLWRRRRLSRSQLYEPLQEYQVKYVIPLIGIANMKIRGSRNERAKPRQVVAAHAATGYGFGRCCSHGWPAATRGNRVGNSVLLQ